MVFLRDLEKITDTKSSIGFIHYVPFDPVNGMGKTQEQLEQEGILIESIPEPQETEGEFAQMFYNPKNKKLFYEYEDVPKTKEDVQEERISELEDLVAGLIGGEI